ncbi:MinD/ParA family protein [Salimicrobium halophilum]|uniref:Flagellar biosynthesis protein FlhG n=1 Tax=Salimicrobium halophilum TaxID=86666 RepID=A0A1G8QAJ1_9BACI|nr:MinD/ParA family protein [Salimicrobium halophilum]SDJ01495.1 flagellar biosynthesis protein FlhG [Salimicrobium halophilum]
MSDQAEKLRRRLRQRQNGKKAKVIAVASGKGGVGKSNVTINFSLELSSLGKRVLIIDLDIGMGNIDILLGLTPRYHMADLFSDKISIRDMIETGPKSLSYIAGGSSLNQFFHVEEAEFSYFLAEFDSLLYEYDYIFFDMGAGASEESLQFISASDETFIVTTSEPTSLTDAYSMIKHIYAEDPQMNISLLMNRTLNERQGKKAMERMQAVISRFLDKEVKALGVVTEDKAVLKAVHRQSPFIEEFPSSKAGRSLKSIVHQYINEEPTHEDSSFLQKLKRLVSER